MEPGIGVALFPFPKGLNMLKITTHTDHAGVTVFALEGRLRGPWVTELERCWRVSDVEPKKGVRVDLSEVTYIDAEGKAMLACMYREGAELIAAGCLTRCMVEEIVGDILFDQSSSRCENASMRTEQTSHTEEKET